jgi:heme exporter protein B
MNERRPTSFVQIAWTIARKDLAVEWYSRQSITTMLVFALMVIFLFNFALELDAGARSSLTSGVLWVTFAFAGTLGLSRSLAAERENGCLDGLLLAPVERSAIYLGKMAANLVLMLAVAAIVLPVYAVLYNQNLINPGLFGIILLGSLGYSAVGTLLSSLAVQSRARDLLLPVLLFPLALPLLVAAVNASRLILEGASWAEVFTWFNLLVVYDVVFLAVALAAFDYVVEE